MSNIQAIADLVEVEALRGEFTDAASGRAYISEFGQLPTEDRMSTTEPTSLTGAYSLDPVRSRLGFVARHTMGPKVRGAFETFDGRIHLDFAEPGRSTAEVTIDAGSVNTGNARRDKQLRSADFFDATGHPRIAFRSTSARRLGDDHYLLAGELTVKDTTKPVTVDIVHADTVDDADGTTRAEFAGRATLDRRDWGLTWGGVLISNGVTLELDVTVVNYRREPTTRLA